ncbi:hypothetical protein BACI349Y_810015 [Bacillus sp. 349Y]|nr:hypothetical protein BACI349Y_810015 [Bacillus sp. 349Y]
MKGSMPIKVQKRNVLSTQKTSISPKQIKKRSKIICNLKYSLFSILVS